MDANSSIPEKSHKPGGGPAFRTPATTHEAIQAFVLTVGGLYEKDFGDFMRRTGMYLDRLWTELAGLPKSEEIAKELFAIKNYLVYSPNLDIEATRSRMIRDVQNINRLV